MRSSRRIFYVVFSRDEYQQNILDAIRYFADPGEKNRAHVTIRGPYRQKFSLSAASKVIDGSEIEVKGVDTFFRPGQNTVFFSIVAPALKRVWYKPEFPGYMPHLTIYDGKSRAFAMTLRSRLEELTPRFRFQATSLSPIATAKGQGSLELRAAYSEDLVKMLTGRQIPVDEVPNLPEEERIELIVKLCSELVQKPILSGTKSSRDSMI